MATMNFSIPQPVKDAFDRAFRGRNKSAVITALIESAVAEEQRKRRRAKAIDALLELRRDIAPVRPGEIPRARGVGRP
ncbi:MAG: hypothetical protein QOD06_2500 [Candidatus Binatota bacterium]|jgi:hypothetical protein|nr:hypothetical protein [Candidatus Binatota bacterium]